MKSREWIAQQIATPDKRAVPCLFYPAIAESGLTTHQALTDAGAQAEILVGIAERYPVAALVRMSELWCEAAAFGAECVFEDRTFPRVNGVLASDAEELLDLTIPDPVNSVTEPMLAAIEKAAKTAGVPVFAGVTGPYTLGSVLGGSEDFMVNCLTEPEAVQEFLDRLSRFLVDYIGKYKQAGAAGVMVAEPSVGMISPDMAEDFSNRYLRDIIAAVQDDGFSVIYHNCGNVGPHLRGLATLGAHAYHIGDAVDMAGALEAFPRDALVMGNIHPDKFALAAAATMERDTAELKGKFSGYPNFVLSSGCDIGPNAKRENLEAFFAVA